MIIPQNQFLNLKYVWDVRADSWIINAERCTSSILHLRYDQPLPCICTCSHITKGSGVDTEYAYRWL